MNAQLAVGLIIVLAVIGVVMQLLDLHTTSEILKRGKGREANGLLGFMNDGRADDDPRFWKLAGLKSVMAGVVLYAGWVAYGYVGSGTLWAPVLTALMAGLDAWYLWVLVNNWRIFKAIR